MDIRRKVFIICAMIGVVMLGLVVYFVVSANSGQKNIMLSQAKNQVQSISLKYSTSSGSYNNEQAADVIDWIYSDIQNTRASKGVITAAEKKKVGQPMFTLVVYYKNGREDVIASDSSGGYIYRILTDRTFDYPLAVSMQESDLAGDSFIGGGNGDLMNFVTQGGKIH